MVGKDTKTGATFPIIFKHVWNRIRSSKDKDEILRIFLTQDIPEMRIVCFVGRISRLTNCLSGFYQDLGVKISITQQIEAKYNIVAAKFTGIKGLPMKYNIMCYYTFKELLEEIEVKKEMLDKWLYPYLEELEEIFENDKPDYESLKLPEDIEKQFKEDYANEIFIT